MRTHGLRGNRYEWGMRSHRILLVLAAAIGLALAATPPAGAAAGSSASRDALTPAAYRAQAGALCVAAKKRIAALPKATSARPAAAAAALNKAFGALEPLLTSFRALDPPPALKATHERTVKGLADGLVLGRQIAAAAAKGSDLQKALARVQAPLVGALSSIQTGFKTLGLAPCESVLGSALGGA